MTKSAAFLKRYPELPFVILAYLIPYAFLVIPVPSGPLYTALLILGSWSPNLAAIAVLRLVLREQGGVRRLFAAWVRWRVGVVWYLVALSPLLIAFVSSSIYLDYLGGTVHPREVPLAPTIFGSLALTLVTGATGEELGWRGFLLPRLQSRFSALAASLLVGAIWGLWHLPLFFIPGLEWSGIPIWSFMLSAVSTSVIAAWMVNSTGGSTLMATLLHLTLNFGPILVDALGLMPVPQGYPISAVIYTILAVGAVMVGGAKVHDQETENRDGTWVIASATAVHSTKELQAL